MIRDDQYTLPAISAEEWAHATCDKYDYMIAAFCGGVAGLIDVFFVGDPLTSMLGKSVDKAADGFVKKAARFFWKNDPRTSGKSRVMPQTLEQSISYLEQAFPVNYDARYAQDLDVSSSVLANMTPKNHHLLSLAHSPDPIGLIFSIIDQFTGCATFMGSGKLIHVMPRKTSGAIPYMQGGNLPAMLFCGFVNWIGHLISDMAGSSSTRRIGKTGRGAGIPMPFYELFLTCNFGNIDGRTFAETMTKVFEEGYDLRFGVTMAIPVVIEELMIKVIWMIRQKFIRGKSWRESFPTKEHADLRIMLIVGNGTLCAIDGVDAAVHGLASGGNVINFICHLNLVGWVRLVTLILRELQIRYGAVIAEKLKQFINFVKEILTPAERELLRQFRARMAELDACLDALFQEFVRQIEAEYKVLYAAIDATFDKEKSSRERAKNSVHLAKVVGVEDHKIIHDVSELDKFFM